MIISTVSLLLPALTLQLQLLHYLISALSPIQFSLASYPSSKYFSYVFKSLLDIITSHFLSLILQFHLIHQFSQLTLELLQSSLPTLAPSHI